MVRTARSGRALDCRGADAGPAERNLAYLAATAYGDTAGWPPGFAVEIDKRIPVGGGLGGGSADAGAVLRALNALNPQPLPARQLLSIGARLGADIPFLASNACLALAWGHGDRFLSLPALPRRDVVLLVPPFGVSTADAYAWVSTARADSRSEAAAFEFTDLASWDRIAQVAANDFEPVVAERHPQITALVATLNHAGASIARLSGSGSTVFGVFEDEPDDFAVALMTGGPDVCAIRTRTARRVEDVELTE